MLIEGPHPQCCCSHMTHWSLCEHIHTDIYKNIKAPHTSHMSKLESDIYVLQDQLKTMKRMLSHGHIDSKNMAKHFSFMIKQHVMTIQEILGRGKTSLHLNWPIWYKVNTRTLSGSSKDFYNTHLGCMMYYISFGGKKGQLN